MNHKIDTLIEFVKQDSNPALGCTEPVAVAYAASLAREHQKGELERLEVHVSKNIFKNGKSVTIPNTGRCGLDLAAAIGYTCGNAKNSLMVFQSVNRECIQKADHLLDTDRVALAMTEGVADVYVQIRAFSEEEVEVVLSKGHTNIEKICVGETTLYQREEEEVRSGSSDFMKELTIKEMMDLSTAVEIEKIAFVLDGVDMNMKAAQEGLTEETGLMLGKKLKCLQDQGYLSADSATTARILTAAAADMRMGGGDCPIMTSGGSGNQGIGVILPIAVVAKEKNLDQERLTRALFFAHAINRYVKSYSGKLSGMCGCAIAAGIGSTAGITWMLGGTDEQIAGACNNMFANLTGMVCDGAKDTCSLKLSTCAAEAVLCAYLALEDIIVHPNVGVIGGSIEESIQNIGMLSHRGFQQVDEVMLDIISQS